VLDKEKDLGILSINLECGDHGVQVGSHEILAVLWFWMCECHFCEELPLSAFGKLA
jgi:hypothetical protein